MPAGASPNSTQLAPSDLSTSSLDPTPTITCSDAASIDNDEVFYDALDDLPGLDQLHPQRAFDGIPGPICTSPFPSPVLARELNRPAGSRRSKSEPVLRGDLTWNRPIAPGGFPGVRGSPRKRPSYAATASRSVHIPPRRKSLDAFPELDQPQPKPFDRRRESASVMALWPPCPQPRRHRTREWRRSKSEHALVKMVRTTEEATKLLMGKVTRSPTSVKRFGDYSIDVHGDLSIQQGPSLATTKCSLIQMSWGQDWEMASAFSPSKAHSNIHQYYENPNYEYSYNFGPESLYSQHLNPNSNLFAPQFAQESDLSALEHPYNPADILSNPTPPISTSFSPGLSSHQYNSVFSARIAIGYTIGASTHPTQPEIYRPPLNCPYLSQTMGAHHDSISYMDPGLQYDREASVDPQLVTLLLRSQHPNSHSITPFPQNPTARADFDTDNQPPDIDTMANLCTIPRVSNPEVPPHESSENSPTPNHDHSIARQENHPELTSQTQMTQLPQQPGSGSESSHVSEMSPAHAGTETPKNYCDICGRSFRRPYLVEDHRRIHTSEETSTYRCEFEGCAKVYKSRSNMTRHFKTHFCAVKARNVLQTSDDQVPDGISERTPVAESSTQDSTRPSDQATPIPGNFRFRPYETPGSVRYKVGKRNA